MEIIEYPVHGINSYTAKFIEEDDGYIVEIYPQDPPAKEEEDWPALIRFILWIFDDPPQQEEIKPLVRKKFAYSVDYVNAVNKMVYQYELPIKHRQELFSWDGQVFEPPSSSTRSTRADKNEPQLKYEIEDVPFRAGDKSGKIRVRRPILVGGKKPRHLKEEAWALQKEARKNDQMGNQTQKQN
ncbi:hypothetical protein [Lihuaxuella thermophila]|uniref:Uncharacterized protein n=1 Tax=Lihuaxuella thermophila TaxID=1173111 RepID=A0A1H8D761_9BACL|nr:hypothetical protein [Lihuaxuella thermophila]SEN02965.1 hypothetical protein SAMN05444955_10518 [Lihuaxuella thermophila]